MAVAIYGEATADHQKSAAKKINPKRFCDTGLYKYVRCPNYFSEVLFWFGVTVSGIGAVQGKQWIMVLVAFVLITFVMYNSAQRLELRHEKTYGLDPEYQKYSDGMRRPTAWIRNTRSIPTQCRSCSRLPGSIIP